MAKKKTAKSAKKVAKKSSRKSARKALKRANLTKERAPMQLQEILLTKLRSLYDVEQEIVRALPKLVKRASNEDLKRALEEHLTETKGHVQRLEEAFSLLGQRPKKIRSEAIRGLVNDASAVMERVRGEEALDANLIAAAQYVEHYEIAGYGSAREWAQECGLTEVADLLQETLDEEKGANAKLNDLATSGINRRASVRAETKERAEEAAYTPAITEELDADEEEPEAEDRSPED